MAENLNFSCIVEKEEGIYTSSRVFQYTTTTERGKLQVFAIQLIYSCIAAITKCRYLIVLLQNEVFIPSIYCMYIYTVYILVNVKPAQGVQ